MRQDHLNHKPNETGIKYIEELKTLIIKVDEALERLIPKSREQALALTKLEECRMWAIKGIVFNNYIGVNEIEETTND